jgi:hypothetical protein
VDLSAVGEDAREPQIVVNSSNTLTAIWGRSNGSNDIIQSSTSTSAGTWSTPVDLSAVGEDAENAQVVVDSSNTLTAIWKRSNGSHIIIQASTRSGSPSVSSGATSAGTPGIFLHITGPVGRSVAGSPVYYGADRVQVTSTYTLTLTPVGGNRPLVTTLAEGTIEQNGSFATSVRLDPLAPGSYDVQFTGTHHNGATLELTSRIVVGPGGEYTLIGDNIPIIR